MHVNFSHVKSNNYAIETEYTYYLRWNFYKVFIGNCMTVGIKYPSSHTISAENCYPVAGQAPVPIWEMASFVL